MVSMKGLISPVQKAELRKKSIERFVRGLGWSKPRRFEKSLVIEGVERHYVWYDSGDTGNNRTDCFLHVNDLGFYDSIVYCAAAVYAPRFKICTGFLPVQLNVMVDVREEAQRLRAWLHRSCFTSPAARHAFRQMHPEVEGYSWSAIREYGPPYRVQLALRKGKPILIQSKSARCKESVFVVPMCRRG